METSKEAIELTPEQKKERQRAQQREWYYRNKEAILKERKEKYAKGETTYHAYKQAFMATQAVKSF
jgi:hypothetical protein